MWGWKGNEIDEKEGDATFLFTPWLTAAPPAGVSFAPVTINSEVQYFPSIQAAVDAAEEGDTITAVAGIFTESGIEADETSGISIIGEEGAIVRAPEGCSSSAPSAVFHLHDDDITLSGFEIDANDECVNAVHVGDLSEITVSGVEVSGNNIYGATYGVTLSWGSSNDSESPNVVSENTIHDNGVGVLIDSAHYNTITDNEITSNSEGILFGECEQEFGGCPGGAPSHNTITGNTIADNGEGDTGIVIGALGEGNSANLNTITGNIVGVSNETETLFDAEKNWWGTLRGPLHDDTNPLGEGDEVSNFVDYSPWCTTDDFAECEEGGTEFLASSDPLDHYDVDPDVSSGPINTPIDFTVTAKDEDDITRVNDTSKASMTVDNGASLGSPLLQLAEGTAASTVNNTIIGLVHIAAVQVGGSATGENTATFTGDETAPTLDSHSPLDGATDVSVSVAPFLVFSESLSASTVNSANIQLKKYDDDSTVAATISLVEGGTKVVITPDSALDFETQYYFAVSTGVQDAAGNALVSALNAGTKDDHEFTTVEDTADHTAPTIVSHNPADNATNISVNVASYIVFSEPMKSSTINSANIQLKKNSDGSTVGATVSLVEGGTTVIITPTSNLETSTQYYFAVSTDVQDEAGNALASALDDSTKDNHEFTTAEDTSDQTAPTVADTNPDDGDIDVSADVAPRITFDEALDSSTVSSATVVLLDSTDTEVPAMVTLAEGNTVIVITPDSTLDYDGVYHIDVSGAVIDVAGNAYAGAAPLMTFTIESEPVVTLAVTGIDAVDTFADDTDDFADGWSWVFHITVPTDEAEFAMKFSDFVSGSNTIFAAGNIRYYSAQSSEAEDDTEAVTIAGADAYPDAITLDSDIDAFTAGRQIEVTVEMKVPVGSAGGSYSASYGVKSEI